MTDKPIQTEAFQNFELGTLPKTSGESPKRKPRSKTVKAPDGEATTDRNSHKKRRQVVRKRAAAVADEMVKIPLDTFITAYGKGFDAKTFKAIYSLLKPLTKRQRVAVIAQIQSLLIV